MTELISDKPIAMEKESSLTRRAVLIVDGLLILGRTLGRDDATLRDHHRTRYH
jgi:hypothetical protein